jgi:predicted Fe-S protein YdhL (DUF1289 family)
LCSLTQKLDEGLSPCIGFCSTTYGDDVCRGCYRNLKEVLQWKQLVLGEKVSFYEQVAFEAQRLLSDKVIIINEEAFLSLCQQFKIFSFKELNHHYALLMLLQRGAHSFLEESKALKKNTKLTWSELYRWVDRELFELRQKIS